MGIYNPLHPGEVIKEIYLEGTGVSISQIAKCLDVTVSTFNRLIKGQASISTKMALRLSKTFGRSAESWLAMQAQYDLWHERKTFNLKNVKKAKL